MATPWALFGWLNPGKLSLRSQNAQVRRSELGNRGVVTTIDHLIRVPVPLPGGPNQGDLNQSFRSLGYRNQKGSRRYKGKK